MSFDIFLMLFISFFLPLLLLILLMKKKGEDLNTRRLPLGPKKLPIIGNLHQIGKLPHRSFQRLSKTYGDFMFMQLGSVPTLIVSSADVAREIFRKHDLAFSGRPPLYAAKKISYNSSAISLAPYGEYWREVRKIVVLELLTLKRVQSFWKIRDEELALMTDYINNHTTNCVNDLSALTFSLSNNIVRRVAFGTNPTDDGPGFISRFQEILHETQDLIGEFNIADYFPGLAWINKFNGTDKRLEKNFQDLDEFFDKVIEEHLDPNRDKTDQEDIIDVLLRIQMDSNKAIPLKNEHIKGVLIDVFVAGTDTSSATVVWTMAELIRNPEVKERAQEEVRKVCKGKAKVEENDLQKLSYLKLVIKESWRLHPPAPLTIPRETIEKCTIDNKYEIPAKTRVIVNASAIGTDPKYWENPEKFWPERFLHKDVDFRGQHFELLPFGAGRRGCPGINFAIPIVELTLANLLFRFDWELPQGMLAEDLDMEEAQGITMHKKIPLCLVATPANVSKENTLSLKAKNMSFQSKTIQRNRRIFSTRVSIFQHTHIASYA